MGIFSLGEVTTGGDSDPGRGSNCCGNIVANDRSLSFTAPSNGTYTFDTCTAGLDTCLYLLDACGGSELAGFCNEDTGTPRCGPVGYGSTVQINLALGEMVTVIVQGYSNSDSGNVELQITRQALVTPPPVIPDPVYVWEGLTSSRWNEPLNWNPPNDGSYPDRFEGFFDTFLNYTSPTSTTPLLTGNEAVSFLRISGPVAKLQSLGAASIRCRTGTLYIERSEALEWSGTPSGTRPFLDACLEIGASGSLLNVSFSWHWSSDSGIQTTFDCVNDLRAIWENVIFQGEIEWRRPQGLLLSARESLTFVQGISFRGSARRQLASPTIHLGQNIYQPATRFERMELNASVVTGGEDEFRYLTFAPFDGTSMAVRLISLALAMDFRESVATTLALTTFECSAANNCVFNVRTTGSCFANDIQVFGAQSRLVLARVSSNQPLSDCPSQSLNFIETGTMTGPFSGVLNVTNTLNWLNGQIRGQVAVLSGGNLTGIVRFDHAGSVLNISADATVSAQLTLYQLILAPGAVLTAAPDSVFKLPFNLTSSETSSKAITLQGTFETNFTCSACSVSLAGIVAGRMEILAGSNLTFIGPISARGDVVMLGALVYSSTSSSFTFLTSLVVMQSSSVVLRDLTAPVTASGISIEAGSSLSLTGTTTLLSPVQNNGSLIILSNAFSASANITCDSPSASVSANNVSMTLSSSQWSFINCELLSFASGSTLNVQGPALTYPFDTSNKMLQNLTVNLLQDAGLTFRESHSLAAVKSVPLNIFTTRNVVLFDEISADLLDLSSGDVTCTLHLSPDRSGKLHGISLLAVQGLRLRIVYANGYMPSGESITLMESPNGAITGSVIVVDFGGIPAILSSSPFQVKLTPLPDTCPPGFFPVPQCGTPCPLGSQCTDGNVIPCEEGAVAPQVGSTSCKICGPGTVSVSRELPCQACPMGTISGQFGVTNFSSCDPSCDASVAYCTLAAKQAIPFDAIPHPDGQIQTRGRLLDEPQSFLSSSGGIIYLAIAAGAFGLLFLIVALLILYCRKKGGTSWEKAKRVGSRADLLFGQNHSNEPLNPQGSDSNGNHSVVVERRTIFGGVATVFSIICFVLLAVFLILDWRASILVTSSVLPFGHLSAIDATPGRVLITVDAFSYGGPCSCGDAVMVSQSGITMSSGEPTVTCVDLDYACRVSFDSKEGALLGNAPEVSVVFSTGHAAALLWNVTLNPYWNGVNGAQNMISQTILPPKGSVLKGDLPTTVELTSIWVQSNDTTHLGYTSSGWLLSHLATRNGSTADVVTFNSSDDGLSALFRFDRGNTYLQVQWQYKQSLPILIGAMFAYFGTIVAIFAMVVSLVEKSKSKMEAIEMKERSDGSSATLAAVASTSDMNIATEL